MTLQNFWRRIDRLVAIAALVGGLGLVGHTVRAQNFPDPGNEAALYEGAKKEGTVVWYGGAPLAPMQAMAADFEKKYPGVKVEILRVVGIAQYQRFMQETEAKQFIADVLHVGDQPSMADLVNRRYIADWKVPTYDRIPPDVRLKINAYTSYLNDANIAYNPNKVTPEEVKILAADWNGILDPRFKGRIATSDQFVGGTYDTLSMFLDPRFADRYGLPFLKAIVAQKPVVYNDIVVPVDRVIAGEQDIAIWPSEGVEYVQYTAGAPIRWVHPKPTPAFGNTWFGVSQFAPHPYAARLFLNWMMGEEGAKSVQTRYGGMTVLMGYPDQRAVTKESWYMPITDRFWPDWELWGRAYTPVMENWRKMLHEGQ